MTKFKIRCIPTLLSLPLVVISLVASASAAAAQSDLQYAIITDSYGNLVGQIAGNGVSVDATVGYFDATIMTRTAAPTGVTMSTLAPALTPTPTTVTVKLPASATVGFCSSGSYYVKTTGQCADGKFPYKIVSVGSVSNPAAQIPTLACAAPRVPTFLTGYGKWMCFVPTGFKLSL